MSKMFTRQDKNRYKKIGSKWRRPKGRQSKMRLKKRNAGRMPNIGYKKPKSMANRIQGNEFTLVRNLKDLESAKKCILIASSLGAKKIQQIKEKAKDFKILNMKSIKRADRIGKKISEKLKKPEKSTEVEKIEKSTEVEKSAEGDKPEKSTEVKKSQESGKVEKSTETEKPEGVKDEGKGNNR